MKARNVKWCPQHGYPLPCDKCGMPLTQISQKEIYENGKKAKIKEVVEWIKSHQLIEPDKDSITRFEPFYQIERKELEEIK